MAQARSTINIAPASEALEELDEVVRERVVVVDVQGGHGRRAEKKMQDDFAILAKKHYRRAVTRY
jgi:hypothetical protein